MEYDQSKIGFQAQNAPLIAIRAALSRANMTEQVNRGYMGENAKLKKDAEKLSAENRTLFEMLQNAEKTPKCRVCALVKQGM
jgi:hypothetical protein